MLKEEIIAHWKRLADEKWLTAESLVKSGRRSDGLFFCHLAIECKLKEIIALTNNEEPPRIHNLVVLAETAKLNFDPERRQILNEITTFNIAGRYDDYKDKFYKRATPEYTEKYYNLSKEILSWLSSVK
ncbi:MAG: HEPN domain-containing protein [Candidatus Vogelbacteria bacterium]|nr:HEPN domain-containing protein [Candidatus Vogelbacteria bacterium]